MALAFSFTCKTLSGVIMKSSITQIERRFDISSSISGLIDGSFEIGNLLVIVFVSYFGSKLHRPKLIGIGCVIMGTGSILTALPHFFMGYYRYSKENGINPSANSTSTLSTCSINQTLLFNRTSPEIVGKVSGTLSAVAMTGPLTGFLLGSLFAKLYVDIGYVDLMPSHINVPLSYCNSDCNCDKSHWEPVCGENGIIYMSPCLAGCKSSGSNKKPKAFYNCSCVDITGFQNRNNSANLGECPRSDHCIKKFHFYLALQVLGAFTSSVGHTPGLMLVFKNVQPELKSLAVGFHALTIRSLGGILAPIYFGAFIDRTCLKWSIDSCGKQGSCRMYNSTLFGAYYFGIIFILKASSLILFIIFIYAMKKKYQRKDTKTSENVKKVVNEANLEPLKNNGHFVSSAGEDGETCI
ncbi:solute carrier organic anion transporter family member 1B3-like [Trichechus manatus latirostris]|uniref:Solute carrier organic anion transporter family member 1B3-like n=1 Tax=Trichechus manatus latirostris TaxID=127582 RepID=A0A2Y9G5H2_TRIMA|nr:solute carrier organic anion transporter family member 1B3-like [Trichechus manatus latirostris]